MPKVDKGNVDHDYLSASDDDEKIGRVPLRNLSRQEREVHIKRLWRTCYNFSLGAAIMTLQAKALMAKIRLYGRQLVAQQNNKKLKRSQQPPWYIIMPESKFKTFWNITVIVLLIYTSTVVPF